MAGDKEPSTKEMVGTTDDHTHSLRNSTMRGRNGRKKGGVVTLPGRIKESSHQPINSNQVPPPVACAQTGKIKQAIEHIYQVI